MCSRACPRRPPHYPEHHTTLTRTPPATGAALRRAPQDPRPQTSSCFASGRRVRRCQKRGLARGQKWDMKCDQKWDTGRCQKWGAG
eukprot:8733446-Pyramimonas_sp.AAC.1